MSYCTKNNFSKFIFAFLLKECWFFSNFSSNFEHRNFCRCTIDQYRQNFKMWENKKKPGHFWITRYINYNYTVL